MAGEDLVVTSGLDLTGLQRDFRRGIGLADQFVSDLQRALSSRDLIGDLTPAGRRAGASLARGLSGSLTGIGVDLARSLDLSSAIAAQGALAGREFTTALGTGIAGADDVLNRIAASVDLSAGGARAGTQFTTGIARVIAAEAPALRAAMSAAIVPTTIATDIGRLEGVITGALARLPVVFQASGVASGAALISGIAGELGAGRQVLAGFSTETSRALTAALTIGDVSGTGERAGRLLAVSVAAGITAEAPRVRGALATALVPSTLAPEVGRITGVFASAGQEIVGLLGAAGTTGGQSLTRNLLAEVGRGAAGLKQLTAGSQIGVVVDAGPVRALVAEQQKLLTATTETTAAMRALDGATAAIDPAGIKSATSATRTLADAQREWLKEAEAGSVAAQGLWQRQRDAAFQAGQQATRNAADAERAAQQEVAARAQVRGELQHDITALGQYGGVVDGTSRKARAAWLAEAAAIRQQAREVGVSEAEMKRLDAIIDQTTASFREQARAAQGAAAQIRNAGQSGARFGGNVVDLRGFQRQADVAKSAIGQISVAGRSLSQITGRLGPALIGVGFGLEALARGGASADAGLRTALRAVASFATFFGPTGFIVAGAAAATAAIIDLFASSRDEMQKTAEDFQKNIDAMVKNVDTIGLQKQLKDLERGTPTRLADGTVEIRGGLKQLRQELALAEVAQRKAFSGQGGSIFKTSQDVDRLTAEVAKQQKVYDSLVRTILTLQSAGSDPALRKPFNITASATGAKDAGEALKQLKDEVGRLSEAYRQLAPNAALQEPIVDRLTDKHEQITRLLKGQTDAASETAVAYREMLKQLSDIDAVLIESTRRGLPGGALPESISKPFSLAVTPEFDLGPGGTLRLPPNAQRITLPAEFDPKTLSDSLRSAIGNLNVAQQQESFAKIFGSSQQVASATKVVNTETQNLTRTFRAAIDAELALANAGTLNVTRINEITAAARALGIDLGQTARTSVTLSDTLSDIGGAAFAIADVASQVGGMNREVVDAIDSVGRLAGALSELSQIKLSGQDGLFSSFTKFLEGLPAIGQAISAVVNAQRTIIGAISGKTKDDANAAIVKKNTEALVRMSQDLRGFGETIGDFTGASDVLDSSAILNARRGTSGFGRGFKNVEALDKEFRAAGLSLADMKRLAEQFGITITDAAGRVSAQGLNDLNIALKLHAAELTRFTDSLKDQTFLADARREIFDANDAADVGRDWLAQMKKFAPELFEKFFGGADVATKAGRDAFEKGIRDVFDLAAANKLPQELIAMFGSAEDFIQFLLGADSALDSLADSANAAASEMVNVVQGFRDFNLDRALFNAQQGPVTGPPMPPRPNPTPIPVGSGAGASVGSLTFAPTIVLRDVGDKDITALSSELVAELKRKAGAIANPAVRQTVNLLPA